MNKSRYLSLNIDKKFLTNSIYLYFLKAVNMLVALIVLPYLVKVLGVDLYGLVSFSQVFVAFFLIFVDFGFELSAVSLISSNSGDKKKISEIFSSVIFLKLIILFIVFAIFCILVFSFDELYKNYDLHFLMFGYVIGQGLFPSWVFQGLQEMRYIAFINALVKVLFLISILVLINEPGDYIKYPILYSLGYLLILPFSFVFINKKFGVKFSWVSRKDLIKVFKYSSHFFWSRLAVTIYDGGGLLFIGLVFSDMITGSYAIADKIRKVITSLYSPISQALYPYMTKYKNISMYKKVFSFIVLFNIFSLCIGFYFAPEFLTLVFGGYKEITLTVWRIFVFVIFLDVPYIFLGYSLLGAFGYTHYVNYSLVFIAIVYLILLFGLFGLSLISIETVAWLYFFTIFLGFLSRLFGSIKYKLWSENN